MGILQRRLFNRGGSVARGTGITSGLINTPKRGYVDGPGSYQGIGDENLPASTAGTCNGIKVVPGQIWACQADSGTALTSAAINATADIVAGDCSTTTGISVYELDSSNVGTGQQVRILGLHKDPDNSFAEHADLLVEWSENASTSNVSV